MLEFLSKFWSDQFQILFLHILFLIEAYFLPILNLPKKLNLGISFLILPQLKIGGKLSRTACSWVAFFFVQYFCKYQLQALLWPIWEERLRLYLTVRGNKWLFWTCYPNPTARTLLYWNPAGLPRKGTSRVPFRC